MKSNSHNIHIVGRKVVQNGVKGRIIDKVEGMKTQEELPDEYKSLKLAKYYPICYLIKDGYKDMVAIWEDKHHVYYSKIEGFLNEDTFQKYLNLIRQAGENLTRINRELRERREEPFEEVI